MTTPENPRAVIGNNQPPSAYDLIAATINDLYDEAKNWADGEAIQSQEMHDTVELLHTSLHEAGKQAEAARVEEKRPLDEAVEAIQSKYNELIGNTKKVKGKVVLGKEALAALLLPWREKVRKEKEAEAAAALAEANRLAEEARAAMAASSGNLAAREEAELLVKEAAAVGRYAKQADKAATSGLGLRSRWIATLVDEEMALDWAYGRAPEAFREMVQKMADGVVLGGMRSVPGFVVKEEKVVAV